ncbi:hypothetical protein RUM44_010030 [Polyplax serrata]|uniref:Uncharacterized protein n=1 Tax=Polyplax serrata TaxID=468196 RepID=A0ABR1AUE5_POLSC
MDNLKGKLRKKIYVDASISASGAQPHPPLRKGEHTRSEGERELRLRTPSSVPDGTKVRLKMVSDRVKPVREVGPDIKSTPTTTNHTKRKYD